MPLPLDVWAVSSISMASRMKSDNFIVEDVGSAPRKNQTNSTKNCRQVSQCRGISIFRTCKQFLLISCFFCGFLWVQFGWNAHALLLAQTCWPPLEYSSIFIHFEYAQAAFTADSFTPIIHSSFSFTRHFWQTVSCFFYFFGLFVGFCGSSWSIRSVTIIGSKHRSVALIMRACRLHSTSKLARDLVHLAFMLFPAETQFVKAIITFIMRVSTTRNRWEKSNEVKSVLEGIIWRIYQVFELKTFF